MKNPVGIFSIGFGKKSEIFRVEQNQAVPFLMEFHQLYPYKLFNRSKNISIVLLTDIFEIQMYNAFDDEVRIGSSK